ncbi:MAG: thiamine-phosphate kinase [Dehalococcoidia bacterium]|nr:thiamine-phosphate kinase [Dehalococcoidia bacterium]
MLVRELGEFGLIELLAETLAAEGVDGPDFMGDHTRIPSLGIGDDAAAWGGEAGTRVLTTDTMVEGVHFSLDLTGWRDLGWKAMAVNLSDVAAMGCVPTCSVVTLGLRDDQQVEGLVEMYAGMAEACRRHGGRVVGGDIVGSPVLFVSVAMEGEAKVLGPDGRGAILKRGAADIGDVIAVTGNLGDSAGGFHMAMEGEPYDDSTDRLRTAHFRPEPRLATGQALTKAGIRAAMDISDGLVGDLTKLCEASGVGAVVRGNEVPVSEALRLQFPDRWLSLALTGGEDYELLFTGREEAVREVSEAVDVPVTVIGEIVDASRGVSVLDSKGDAIEVEGGGWDHFATSSGGG